jgi:hypothetical protein
MTCVWVCHVNAAVAWPRRSLIPFGEMPAFNAALAQEWRTSCNRNDEDLVALRLLVDRRDELLARAGADREPGAPAAHRADPRRHRQRPHRHQGQAAAGRSESRSLLGKTTRRMSVEQIVDLVATDVRLRSLTRAHGPGTRVATDGPVRHRPDRRGPDPRGGRRDALPTRGGVALVAAAVIVWGRRAIYWFAFSRFASRYVELPHFGPLSSMCESCGSPRGAAVAPPPLTVKV